MAATKAASTAPVTNTGRSDRDPPRRGPAPASTAPLTVTGAAGAGTDAGTGSGSRAGADRRAASSASRAPAVGRSLGRLARQPATTGRSPEPRPSSCAGLLTSRYISAALDPEPNGPCPLPAKASTVPRLKMSLAGPKSWPRTCSGDRKPGSLPGSSAAFQIP
jgi:hypothetical protein